MIERQDRCGRDIVIRIGQAIRKKFDTHQDIIKKSPNYGRLIWRVNKKNGQIEVELELKL